MKTVIFEADSLKYEHTGMFHFCKNLGEAIQKENHDEFCLGFYLRKKNIRFYGGEHDLKIIQNSLHKYYMWCADNVNVWHCTNQASNYFPFTHKCKVVLTIHDLNFLHERHSQEKKEALLLLLKKKLDRADKIITISHYVKEELYNNTAIKKDIQVIYNGCNYQPESSIEFDKMALPDEFIFTMGTVTPKKNFKVLLPIIANTNYHLLIAGVIEDVAYKKDIMEEANKLGIASKIKFLGAIKEGEKNTLFSKCIAFCFPSIAEGFGLPVLEAMHFGKPVFLSTCTSLPEIGGNVAYYFYNFNSSEMVETFQQGLIHFKDNNPAIKLIERAHQFSWKDAAKQYIKVYNSLI